VPAAPNPIDKFSLPPLYNISSSAQHARGTIEVPCCNLLHQTFLLTSGGASQSSSAHNDAGAAASSSTQWHPLHFSFAEVNDPPYKEQAVVE
jgi:hypothetical protein